MTSVLPPWQTEDLVEEWVESSPSPPPASPPTESLPIPTINSIRAKRGSLRALGHAPARSLPQPRQSSSTRIISGHSDTRILSEKINNTGQAQHVLSPPLSGNENVDVVGTFVVKEGVEDNRGGNLAGRPGKGRDMFGPSALEKMFQPPSPPQPPTAQCIPPPPPSPPRRASHAYAPARPSRLSKSVTPSNASITLSLPPSEGDPTGGDSVFGEDTIPRLDQPEDGDSGLLVDIQDNTRELQSGEFETDLSPIAKTDYPFTFTAPRSTSSPGIFDPSQNGIDGGEPSHSTIHDKPRTRQPKRSPKVHRVPSKKSTAISSKPGLRLFRGTYDTYTREHLSALVDSIAIEPSPTPSPPSNHQKQHQHPQDISQWSQSQSPAAPPRTTSPTHSPSESSDMRSSKRMRMSPQTPARAPGGVRDWGAAGKALMEKIRGLPIESSTEESRSRSRASTEQEREEQEESLARLRFVESSPVDEPRQLPGTKQIQGGRGNRPSHRSNPSTTSSGYLKQAEQLMARIRAREVSWSPSADEDGISEGRAATKEMGRGATQKGEWEDVEEDEDETRVNSGESGSSSASIPQRGIRNAFVEEGEDSQSQRDALNDELEEYHGESSIAEEEEGRAVRGTTTNEVSPPLPLSKTSLQPPRRPISSSSTNSQPSHPSQPPTSTATTQNLNRFISTTTRQTSTTISTSFVKHPGPRVKPPIRIIKPEDVDMHMGGVAGKMRYDAVEGRWVRDRGGEAGLGRVDEGAAGGSEESVDVFEGLESWGNAGSGSGSGSGRARGRGSISRSIVREVEEMADEVEVEGSEEGDSDDDLLAKIANSTHVQDQNDLSTSSSQSSQSSHSDAESDSLSCGLTTVPFDPTQPVNLSPAPFHPSLRPPLPKHTNSAPAVLTPAHPSSSANKPIRSALRNNARYSGSGMGGGTGVGVGIGGKKKAGWHESVTPRGERNVRSVSFSDGKKVGKIEGVGLGLGEGNMRSRMMDDVLQDMDDLSLEEQTPSKPPRHPHSHPNHTKTDYSLTSNSIATTDQDLTIRPNIPRGITPGHGAGEMTFMTDKSYGVNRNRLVQHLTDVYGSKPWWDGLVSLDLREKGVESLEGLGEFLPDLEEVYLDGNKLSYLTGIPEGVLRLFVASNRLTSLSSLDGLRNLQILDLSNNQLDSLSQLECLRHLRELKADGNRISSLKGVMGIDGLEVLCLAGNRLSRVDLGGCNWSRLVELDLSNNRIESVMGLEGLGSLDSLDLEDNRLTEFGPHSPMTSLRTLKLSNNDLSTFDVSLIPKARTVYLDANRLRGIDGKSRRLQTLSIRSQGVAGLVLGCEVLQGARRLYISGNKLSPDFLPTTPLPNLQYLEAARCSLSKLPSNPTLATRTPNLRYLNLNYNYLTDLDGLRGLVGLRKLTVVGGKLGGGGDKTGVIRGLDGLINLEEVDLRMNPSTLSFYLPLLLSSPHPTTTSHATSQPPPGALPNVTLANPLPIPGNQTLAQIAHNTQPPNADWRVLDRAFRKGLPDEWFAKRLVYRGMIMRVCRGLRVLDGVEVEEGERKKAEGLLRGCRK